MLQLRRALQLFPSFRNVPKEESLHGSSADQISARQIQRTGSEEQFALIAYCFMPDHVHLAIRGLATESNLRRFVKIAKQRVAYLARRQFAIPALWQDSYYERVVRSHGMESLVRYILNNPMRAGLVKDGEQYPFSGSFCD